MRVSCNGCRVLRKGCSDNCSIRPCLEWIRSPESQANATVFLAKFYGRAGLMNLINARPHLIRPAIFKSLLHEACGRIVNPIYGSVGLLCSGNWQLCQNAVEAVLKGDPITRIAADVASAKTGPPLKAYDIRHVNKKDHLSGSNNPNRVRARCHVKRKTKRARTWVGSSDDSAKRSPSHESSLSHEVEVTELKAEEESPASADQSPGAYPSTDSNECGPAADGEIELDLTLSLEPFKPMESDGRIGGAACKMEMEDQF